MILNDSGLDGLARFGTWTRICFTSVSIPKGTVKLAVIDVSEMMTTDEATIPPGIRIVAPVRPRPVIATGVVALTGSSKGRMEVS